MPKYIIERTVPGANTLTAEELRDISTKSNGVVAGLGVPYVWNESFVAGDKIFCIHEAPSPEVIRHHATLGGFPIDSITEVAAVIGPWTGQAA